MPAPDPRAGRAAFTHPAFTLFQIARFLIVAAMEMQAVAVGWQVYEITKRPLDLGLVGLAQFLPGILLFPISGHASDRYERRNVLTVCYAGFALCFALLLALAWRGVHSIAAIYVVLILLGGRGGNTRSGVFGASLETACEVDCALEMKVIPSKILEKLLSGTPRT